jgi:hypothetical protein
MKDGDIVVVDVGNGIGVILKVRDIGSGYFAADRLDGKTLTFDPNSPMLFPKWDDNKAGEWQAFTVHGDDVICFAPNGGNAAGNARLCGFVKR